MISIWAYLLKALVSLTFLLCLDEFEVGLSGGDVLELILWLKLSVLLTGLGKTGGVVDALVLLGPVWIFNFDGNVIGTTFEDELFVEFASFCKTLVDPGLGATGGGILVGGGIVRVSSLKGSG